MEIETTKKVFTKRENTHLAKQGTENMRNRRKNHKKKRNPVYKKAEKNKMLCEENYFSNFTEKIEKARNKTSNDLALYLIQILKEENVFFFHFFYYFSLKNEKKSLIYRGI